MRRSAVCFSRVVIGQPHHTTHPHLLSPGQATPYISFQEIKSRRDALAQMIPAGCVAWVVGNRVQKLTNDLFYQFRQNSNMQYLSGFLEPSSAMVIDRRDNSGYQFHMLVPERNTERELWDGPRCGTENATQLFGADKAFTSLETMCSSLGFGKGEAHLISKNTNWESFTQSLERCLGRKVSGNIDGQVDRLRLFKSADEVAILSYAGEIAANAFNETIKGRGQFTTERQIQARLEFEMKMRGADGPSFTPVVAQGANATCIHYIANTSTLKSGNLVLADCGADYWGYCSDISRTFPVGETFTPAQKDLYNLVLDAQTVCIEMCRRNPETNSFPSLNNLHVASIKRLTQGLIDMKLLQGSLDHNLHTRGYERFYPHMIGHYLGMDVHDTLSIPTSVELHPGMYITVEPGLYIPDEDGLPSELRGVGIRIEDNILIQEGAPKVLTEAALKDPSHLSL